MAQEIEVKYLVKELPGNLHAAERRRIRQGYIVANNAERVVRIRQKGEHYFLTVKGPGLRSREEVEISLSQVQFDTLWPLTAGKQVEKTRYYLPFYAHTIELDVFEGALGGLCLAEIEFESEKDAESFKPPDWFGREVTEDGRYHNSSLAQYGKPQNR